MTSAQNELVSQYAQRYSNCAAGKRGDFLGEVSLTREDLEIGRELNLPLGQRKGVKRGPIQGTITLQVGKPLIEEIEQEQGQAMDATADTTTTGFRAEKEVGYRGGQAMTERLSSGCTMRDPHRVSTVLQRSVSTIVPQALTYRNRPTLMFCGAHCACAFSPLRSRSTSRYVFSRPRASPRQT